MNRYRVIAEVKEIKGNCPIYKIGDKLVFERFYLNAKKSQNFCIHAFTAMSTLISAFLHGESATNLGIGNEPNIGYIQCPDPGAPYTKGGTVIFELKRNVIKN